MEALTPTEITIAATSDAVIEQQASTKTISCYSEKLNLKFQVNIQNEAVQAQQRCFILTVHDLGHDSSQFDQFVQSEQMTGLRNRIVWLHVNLPGQEADACDLNLKKYPSLEDLGDELVCIVDYLKIPQVVCMGDGVGANICAHFAIKHSKRCLGLVLIEPVACSASLFEILKSKLRRNSLSSSKSSVQDKASLIFNRMKSNSIPLSSSSSENDTSATAALLNTKEEIAKNSSDDPETLQLEQVVASDEAKEDKEDKESSASSASLPGNSQEKLDADCSLPNTPQQQTTLGRNAKNLTLLAQAFSTRSSLIEKVKDLNIDILTAVGKESLGYNEAKKFYRSLQENRKKEPQKLVNCPFLDLETTVNVLKDRPERLASSLQYFLQGIGLLSAMPMMKSSMLLQYARSMSMEEADRPRSSSIQSEQSLITSPLVSSNPSINESN